MCFTFSQEMKIPLLALLLASVNLTAGEQSWEIVQAVTEQVSDQGIKITVTIRNVANEDQIIPASLYDGQDGLALPNSFLWPEGLTMKEAMRPPLSHYYTHNSRSCHGVSKQLTIRPKGEVSFILHDEIATIGKRLLLVFDSGIAGLPFRSVPSPIVFRDPKDLPDDSWYRPIGAITVAKPKTREQAVDGNPH
jgi:hypothetical protein